MSATQSSFGRVATNSRLTRSSGLPVSGAGFVVRGPFAREIPRRPASRMSRRTVDSATFSLRRRSSAWIFRTP